MFCALPPMGVSSTMDSGSERVLDGAGPVRLYVSEHAPRSVRSRGGQCAPRERNTDLQRARDLRTAGCFDSPNLAAPSRWQGPRQKMVLVRHAQTSWIHRLR